MAKSNLADPEAAEVEEPIEIDKTIVVKRKNLLGTGSTMLNLACSNTPFGGFLKGYYYWLVGDSDSGKTFFSMTCFAEATLNDQFKGYRFIYDNVEDGMLMNTDKLFGESVADRMEPPSRARDGTPVMSDTVEAFYFNLDTLLNEGKPFIYVLDSMDGIDSEAANKKFNERKKDYVKRRARAEGDTGRADADDMDVSEVKGQYTDGKAKANSENMRKVLKRLKATGSILIVISQTRDTFTGYGGKKASGGRALAYYATMQIWTRIAHRLKKEVNKIDRDIGSTIEIEIRRNRITGMRVTTQCDIYPSFGIDDIGTCVDYLIEERYWVKTKQTIEATGLGISGTRDKIIKLVERRNLEDKLRNICGKCWSDVLDAMTISRKHRYASHQ